MRYMEHNGQTRAWGGGYEVPTGPKVVPFWGSYIEFYKVLPKRNYFGAYGIYCSFIKPEPCSEPAELNTSEQVYKP